MADVLAAPTDDTGSEIATPTPTPTRTALPVIEGGLVTTVLTLGFLYWLAHKDVDFNPMGFYANYVLPVGALLVGCVAGSGYGVMSWLRGVKIRRGLLATVVLFQLVAYVAAEYTAYLDVVNRVSAEAAAEGERFEPAPFLTYFHYKAENFAWKSEHGKGTGQPLGHWGYFFVGLAALGFVAGGLIAPAVAMSLPYCEGCARYMKTKPLGFIPATVPYRKVKKKDEAGAAAYGAEQDAAAIEGQRHVDHLTALAGAGDGAGFSAASAVAFGPKKVVNKLFRRIRTDLIHCPGCGRGWVRQTALIGQGKQLKQVRLHQTEVPAAFTAAVLSPDTAGDARII